MNGESTHTVQISITGRYPHGQKEMSSVSVAGDGAIDHMLQAFRAALLAAGFMPTTVARLGLLEEE